MGQEEEEVEAPRIKKRKYLVEDVVTKASNKIEPLLVDFANGQPLDGADLQGTLHRFTDKLGVHFKNSALTIHTPALTYAGTETSAQQLSGVSTFLGLMDKATGRIRLVEVSQFTVQPVIKKHSSRAGQEKDEPATYAEKQEAIAAYFGSKKAKQAVAMRRQNQVEAETMSQAIDHAAAAAATDATLTLSRQPEQSQGSSLLDLLPPCNREASQVEDVYCLQELAPDSFLALMEDSASAILSGQQDLDPKSTLLFREMVENAKHESKFGDQLRLCSVALLVNHLLAFLTCRANALRDFEKGKGMDVFCKSVVVWILQEYTQKQGGSIVRAQRDEDRAMCLLLILAFISNQYVLPASTLLQSLPIKKDRLNQLMRIIGATYRVNTHSFLLKLPLAKLPTQPRKGRRSK